MAELVFVVLNFAELPYVNGRTYCTKVCHMKPIVLFVFHKRFI